uniref:Uncharacterized protein n=1 Tax=Monodelphis domestica TaxID=13616 RepID=F7D5M4_MONDO
MEGPEAPTSHLASGSTSPTWAAQLRDGRGRPAEGRGQAEPRANGMGSTAQAPKVAAQCTPTMSQRPPRNFRRRQADSGSSSDPDLDPEPSPDSGLTGRASERASGASGSRGRARVWATSRRAETRPAPKREAQDFSGSSGDSAGRLSDPPRAPAHADFLPLSGSPRQRGLALKGSSDSDSEDEPDPRGQAASCSSEGPDAASSEEEAQDTWETQQMRKALRVPGGGLASGLCHVPTSPAGKRVSDWAGSFPPVSLESIKKQLSSRLASLEDVHRCHQREYECRRQDADSARKAVAALQEAPDPAPTYAFYRSLKDYLAVLLDCLSEKTAAIEALESALRALLRDRAASRLKRRQEELRSEAAHLQQLAARSTDCAPDAPGLCEQAAARRSQGSRPQPREGPSSEEEPEEEADLRDRQGRCLSARHVTVCKRVRTRVTSVCPSLRPPRLGRSPGLRRDPSQNPLRVPFLLRSLKRSCIRPRPEERPGPSRGGSRARLEPRTRSPSAWLLSAPPPDVQGLPGPPLRLSPPLCSGEFPGRVLLGSQGSVAAWVRPSRPRPPP